MRSFAFNVWLDNKLIDTVFYQVSPRNTIKEAVEEVKHSLVNHDGYDFRIKVTWPKGQRITKTEYVVQGNYGYGWEDENFETTYKDAKRSIKEYRGNYLAEIFNLKRDKEHKDRYATDWGNKTAIGIYEVAKRIIEREGITNEQYYIVDIISGYPLYSMLAYCANRNICGGG